MVSGNSEGHFVALLESGEVSTDVEGCEREEVPLALVLVRQSAQFRLGTGARLDYRVVLGRIRHFSQVPACKSEFVKAVFKHESLTENWVKSWD